MKTFIKYTLPVFALGALVSCSEEFSEDAPSFGDISFGKKELIALSGNDNSTTRAALTRAGFTAATKVMMRIKAEAGSNPARFAEATATAAAEVDGSGLSNLTYEPGLERYWDDAFGRESKLTIYAFAIPGKTNAKLPDWSKTDWVKVDTQTNPNWYNASGDDTEVTWSVSDKQTSETMPNEDLAYSNNISVDGKGGRYTYKYESNAWTETKFGDGQLVWTPKTNKAGETTGKFDKGHLVFNHALAWIEINLKEGDGFNNNANTDFKWSKNQTFTGVSQNITLKGFNTNGTFNVATGTWSDLEANDITLMNERTSSNPDAKTTRQLYAYVLPGTDLYSTTTNVVEFEIDNAKYYVSGQKIAEAIRSYYTTGAGKNDAKASSYQDFTTIESGKHYVINLSVSKKSVDRITAAIVDWETVNSDDAEAKNTYPEFTLDDRGTKLDDDDEQKFALYRAAQPASDYITGATEPNYNWASGYSTASTKEWDDAKKVWKTNWFWENNLTYYHFRAAGYTENSSTTPVTIKTDTNDKDYFSITSGTLAGSDYKDYVWGAPFNSTTGNLSYSTDDGFDNASDSYHQISNAIGTTARTINMLQFHMTSQIKVNIKTTTDASKVTLKDDNKTLKIAKVEILNFLPEGKVLMGNGKVSTTSSARTNATMSNGNYKVANGTEPDKVEDYAFGIVPQSLKYTGGTVGLRITTPDGNQYVVKDLSTCTATVSANNLTNPYDIASDNKYTIDAWYPNYKYTYTITIKKTGVERITAAVVGWEEVTGDLGTIDLEN